MLFLGVFYTISYQGFTELTLLDILKDPESECNCRHSHTEHCFAPQVDRYVVSNNIQGSTLCVYFWWVF